MVFTLAESYTQSAVIKVIGIGGCGGNAVQYMTQANIKGVDFICANTDVQALNSVSAKTLLQLGEETTKGLGAGATPEIGKQAAIDDKDRIQAAIEGSDMLFITAGMGGGTGTGAAPVVAQIARALGILTVAVVTKPFEYEGDKRMQIANEGISELEKHVDSLIIIPNEKLLNDGAPLLKAFAEANDVLLGAVRGIAELITCPGLINLDFADVRTVMSEMGMAMMGSASAKGQDRARQAAESAINNPLLEDVNLMNVKGILVNITAGSDFLTTEYKEVGSAIAEIAAPDATQVIGVVIDEEIGDEVRVTVVATGIGYTHDHHAGGRNIRMVSNIEKQGPDTGGVRYEASENAQIQKSDPRKVTDPIMELTDKEPYGGIVDIPAFLKRQAD